MKTEIVRGVEADSLLTQGAFRVEWSRLGGQCPWATAFQTPGFVATPRTAGSSSPGAGRGL